MTYNEELWSERHKKVEEKLGEHDKRLDDHDTEISNLKVHEGEHGIQIDNLVVSISNLVNTIKWLIGILIVPLVTGIVGFFFYAIQKKVL